MVHIQSTCVAKAFLIFSVILLGSLYWRTLLLVLGTGTVIKTWSRGTQHTSSLAGQTNDVAGPGGHINCTFTSSYSSFLSTTLPSHHLPSYMQNTFFGSCLLTILNNEWTFFIPRHSTNFKFCGRYWTEEMIVSGPCNSRCTWEAMLKFSTMSINLFLFDIKCLDVLEVFTTPLKQGLTGEDLAIYWSLQTGLPSITFKGATNTITGIFAVACRKKMPFSL